MDIGHHSFTGEIFREELENNILRFWREKMQDHEHGGFYGAIDGENKLLREANKGAVMHARVLWTFSAAYRMLNNAVYLEVAQRAYSYIKHHFIDAIHGGVFWELDYQGNPVNRKKQTYAQGFALYAFSEYYRATGDKEALDLSIEFFELIETCRDSTHGGYWEAFTEDWKPLEDMRLSEKDENEAKTMNTHLHILEPYTNLLRIWPDKRLFDAQRKLIKVFMDKIYNPQTGHLGLFFSPDWQSTGGTISYGHDIEAAWLLWEAATLLGDHSLRQKVKSIVIHVATAAKDGLLSDGSMAYEWKDGEMDKERHWWVQAEAVVGFYHLSDFEGCEDFKDIAAGVWNYIQQYVVDSERGEWYWSRLDDGRVNRREDKAGFWKCPYHNGRMCLEMMV